MCIWGALGCGEGSADTDGSTDTDASTSAGATATTASSMSSTSSSTTSSSSTSDASTSSSEVGSSEGGSTTEASSGGAETTMGGSETTDGPPEGAVPMFVALGQGARTTVSCDDGMSWVHETQLADDNDDHGLYSSRGLTYGDGTFIAAVGWGNPGSMRVSSDGVAWEETFPFVDREGNTYEPSGMVGVAFGAGIFVGVERDNPWISQDNGQTWVQGEDIPDYDNLRVVGYSGYDGGRFYAAGDEAQLFVSSDGGQTWAAPSSVTGGTCSGGNLTRQGGMVGNDELFVVVTSTGNACRTDDGGETFTIHAVSPGETDGVVSGDVAWTGEQFYASSRGRGFFSDDAMTWTEVEYNLPNASLRKIAVSPDTGTFVGVERDGATFYRSADGVEWTVLGPEAASAGTDITQIVYGYGAPTDECPAVD